MEFLAGKDTEIECQERQFSQAQHQLVENLEEPEVLFDGNFGISLSKRRKYE